VHHLTGRDLEARPDEDRNVTVVCLGIELAAQAWLEDWNRLRRGRNAINRIEVIEPRTDERAARGSPTSPHARRSASSGRRTSSM